MLVRVALLAQADSKPIMRLLSHASATSIANVGNFNSCHAATYGTGVASDKIADHVSLWGSLLLFRREFDQYINLRPARLMPGIIAPVVRRDGSPRQPGEIDMYIVRENTEGEYSSIGGRMYPGTEREIVMQETVMSRIGVDRVLKFAFELAQTRPIKDDKRDDKRVWRDTSSTAYTVHQNI